MSFDKKYPKSKDARRRMKRYRDARDHDRSCRNHGSCAYCEGRRTFNTERRKAEADGKLE